ncbi:MAG: thermonuclease family protein [Rhodoferax sp.]|nr:thermonuclease family protein [Rhodoferax sp.]
MSLANGISIQRLWRSRNVSKQSLADTVAGQSVAVEWVKVDRYGRKVGTVMLADLDCNLVQVKRGLASMPRT